MRKLSKLVISVLLVTLIIGGTTACSTNKNSESKISEHKIRSSDSITLPMDVTEKNPPASKVHSIPEIEYMKIDLRKADKNLADIGTSEEELERLLVNYYTVRAKDSLKQARKKVSPDDISDEIQSMKEFLKKANKNLIDIETDEEELERLRIEGHVSQAKMLLGKIRNYVLDRDMCAVAYVMKDNLRDVNKSLEDIGTSEEELERLLKIGYMSEAKFWLKRAKEKLTQEN